MKMIILMYLCLLYILTTWYLYKWCWTGIDVDIVTDLDIEVEEEVAGQVGDEEEGEHHLLLQ